MPSQTLRASTAAETARTPPQDWYGRWGKRALDLFFATVGVVGLSPLLAACAAAVRLSSAGPILFQHKRVGQYGKLIRVLKFRTMLHSQVPGHPKVTVAGDSRITRSGRFLRRYKLDELPQLINVLRGEMSLVGPRPEVEDYVQQYSEQERVVLNVKPGITGAASLAFSDEEDELARQKDPLTYYVRVLMPRKLALEISYTQNLSLRNDLALILRTIAKVAGLSH